MRFLYSFAFIVVAVPVFSYAIFLVENGRAGLLPRVRGLCGGRLVLPLVRAACNSAWSIGLVILAYPLGWLPKRSPRPSGPGGLPPVILTHGLYHNASAWFLFRRRLARCGFADVRTYAYASFFQSYEDIVEGLVQTVQRAAAESPTGRVLLVGHSLGGMVIRSACVSEGVCGRVAAIVTLGTPHQGSNLAGTLALGLLGRGLRQGGEVLASVRGKPVCPGPALSLYSPVDSMVLPLTGSLLEEREKCAGWLEICLPPTSHVGMLYDSRVVELSAEFLLRAASRPASP
ncbi:MAG: alpha/beta fold hydrolase [Proteobacteria bacterium]|nr:alpha/beta fold hydrolase [Pseudomonadota bacterium]